MIVNFTALAGLEVDGGQLHCVTIIVQAGIQFCYVQ